MTSVQDAVQAAVPVSIVVALYHASHAPFLGVRLPAFLIDVGYDTACTMIIAALVTSL